MANTGDVAFQASSTNLVDFPDLNNQDDVFALTGSIFADGFESGDTTAW